MKCRNFLCERHNSAFSVGCSKVIFNIRNCSQRKAFERIYRAGEKTQPRTDAICTGYKFFDEYFKAKG